MFSGRRIRQARELRRLTQSDLAQKVGVVQSAIAHVESEFKNPSRSLITKIAMHTHFPVSFFTIDPATEFPVQSLLFRAKSSMTKRDAAANPMLEFFDFSQTTFATPPVLAAAAIDPAHAVACAP